MIYILTGCDCSGKTTMFNLLKKDPEFKNYLFYSESYCGKKIENRILRFKQLKFFLKNKKNDFIFDRCTVIEDHIYEYLFNSRKSCLSEKKCAKKLRKCKIIYFNLDNEVIYKRLKNRGDEYVNFENVEYIKKEYIDFFKRNKINYIEIKEYEKDEMYKKIKQIIKGEKNEK